MNKINEGILNCSFEINGMGNVRAMYKEIKELLKDILKYLNLLYHKEKKGFSYFVNKSQTHYYGIEISKGKNLPDIHGTILSVWAIVMILEILEKNIYNYKTIKP